MTMQKIAEMAPSYVVRRRPPRRRAPCADGAAPRTGPISPLDVLDPPADQVAPAPAEDFVRITGTVHRLDLEGGVYVIRTDDGTQYRPIELPEEFRVEGLAVEVEAKRRDDVLTVDMAGQAIELLDIRKRVAE
jgi:hypothetical protein